MKAGDLVIATRKIISHRVGARNRYMGIFIKSDYGDKFIECFTPRTDVATSVRGAGDRMGRFSPDFWDVEVVSENR
jgi:hypothetical protein